VGTKNFKKKLPVFQLINLILFLTTPIKGWVDGGNTQYHKIMRGFTRIHGEALIFLKKLLPTLC